MATLINSFSFVVGGVLIVVVVAILAQKFFGMKWMIAATLVAFLSLITIQLQTSTKINTVSNPKQFEDALIAGKPVVLELYSNF